jgi:hypothetical protein
MPNVDKPVCSCVCLLAFLALAAVGCNSAHVAGITETGNPPVIDIEKVSLAVSTDDVRIVGKPGAVTPGGADVEIEIVGSGETAQAKAAPDGSFDILVKAGADAVLEVKASSGEQVSETVYVTRGGASVGTGDAGQLSCQQRDQLASQVVVNATNGSDASCETAADCVHVSTTTMCRDTCSGYYTGKKAAAAIEAAVQIVDEGFCAGYAADGCTRIIPPCMPPATGPVACVDHVCTQQTEPATPACPPNARYVDNVCDQCGLGGGCMTIQPCAIVCADTSNCTSRPGTVCSTRGICEQVACI